MGRGQNVCDTWYLVSANVSHSSRHRKIKCDAVQPVCGPCSSNARQCGGVGYFKRLIVKDETDKFINKFSRSRSGGTSPVKTSSKETPSRGDATTTASAQTANYF